MADSSQEPLPDARLARGPVAEICVEPWPAGGWVVRLEDDPAPLSRHDTEEEARFRADAYRRALSRGQQLATSPQATPVGPATPEISEGPR